MSRSETQSLISEGVPAAVAVSSPINLVIPALKFGVMGLMIAAHEADHPLYGAIGPFMMGAIMLSSGTADVLNHFGVKPKVAETLATKLAPYVATVTVSTMFGQQTMVKEKDVFVMAALGIFATPAGVQLVFGKEVVDRIGLNLYVMAMKMIELVALGLFGFATYAGIQKDPDLKFQLAGVSALGVEAGIQIGKHSYRLYQAAKEEKEAAKLIDHVTALNA